MADGKNIVTSTGGKNMRSKEKVGVKKGVNESSRGVAFCCHGSNTFASFAADPKYWL